MPLRRERIKKKYPFNGRSVFSSEKRFATLGVGGDGPAWEWRPRSGFESDAPVVPDYKWKGGLWREAEKHYKKEVLHQKDPGTLLGKQLRKLKTEAQKGGPSRGRSRNS